MWKGKSLPQVSSPMLTVREDGRREIWWGRLSTEMRDEKKESIMLVLEKVYEPVIRV